MYNISSLYAPVNVHVDINLFLFGMLGYFIHFVLVDSWCIVVYISSIIHSKAPVPVNTIMTLHKL